METWMRLPPGDVTGDDPMTGNDLEHLEARQAAQEREELLEMALETFDECCEENPY